MKQRVEKWRRLRAAKPVSIQPFYIDAGRLVVDPVKYLATNISRLSSEGRGAREAARAALDYLLNPVRNANPR